MRGLYPSYFRIILLTAPFKPSNRDRFFDVWLDVVDECYFEIVIRLLCLLNQQIISAWSVLFSCPPCFLWFHFRIMWPHSIISYIYSAHKIQSTQEQTHLKCSRWHWKDENLSYRCAKCNNNEHWIACKLFLASVLAINKSKINCTMSANSV